eukprot:EG_transcript_60055
MAKKVAQLSSKRSHSDKTVEPQHERHVDAANMAGKWCGHTKDLENLSRKLKSKLQGKAAAWSPPSPSLNTALGTPWKQLSPTRFAVAAQKIQLPEGMQGPGYLRVILPMPE